MSRDVSILVRVRNEREALERLLACLANQEFDGSVEIVVIDNGSEDGSAEVALAHGARVFSLPRHLFTYGRAINVGFARCSADLVILLSAHAWPKDTDWLDAMTARLTTSPDIEAAYCRQMPEYPIGRQEGLRFQCFSTQSRVMDAAAIHSRLANGADLYAASYFSNSACIIRKSAVQMFPMRDLPYAEENAFALDCIVSGRRVAYLGSAQVCYKGPLSRTRLYQQHRRQMIAERLIEDHYSRAFGTSARHVRATLKATADVALLPAMLIGIGFRRLFDRSYRQAPRPLRYDLCAIAGVWGRLVGGLTWRKFRDTLAADQDALKVADAATRALGMAGT